MHIERIYAHVSCSDLEVSKTWYETLFDRGYDVAPMESLREWHHGQYAGLQLFHDAAKAGSSTVTLIVSDLEGERSRLEAHGVEVGEIEIGDKIRILQLSDLDGNLVVLAEPQQ